MTAKARYRTIFLSDLHLGCPESRAEEAAEFLKHVECRELYLVGDIIDMWSLRRKWVWPEHHNRFVRRVLKIARKGTRVVFIPGNHDEPARRYAGLSFGGIEIALQATHVTADGRTLLIMHGDELDLVVKHAPLLAALGGWAYDRLLKINRVYNRLRRMVGLKYWSLSKYLKLRVKSACRFISKFEHAVAEAARRAGADGVVCGHIHKPEITSVGGIAYYNCGDWVEESSVLVEHEDGRMEILDGAAEGARLKALREAARAEADAGQADSGEDDDAETVLSARELMAMAKEARG